MTTDLPPDVRDRAAKKAFYACYPLASPGDYEQTGRPKAWPRVVDAVVEVVGDELRACEHLDGPYRRLLAERDELRAALADLVANYFDAGDLVVEGDLMVQARRLVTPDTEEQSDGE